MDKTIVIYISKYGHTKKYAQWLSEELNADIIEGKRLKENILSDYSTIVFGGSLYFERCKAANLLVKHFNQIRDKKVVLFTVGVFSQTNFIDVEFSREIEEKIKIFQLKGGLDFKKLSFLHKMGMKFFRNHESKKPENEQNNRSKLILSLYGKKTDFTEKKQLEPVIQYCLQI